MSLRLGVLMALSALSIAAPAKAQSRQPFVPPGQIQAPTPAPVIAPPPAPVRPKPAASAAPAPSPQPTAAAAPVAEPPPPYEPQLLRLGEMMGALSYLRDLCRDGDGPTFRDKFAQLMEIEAHSEERKDALAGAFNRGFEDYELTYRVCTASAHETIAHYLEETQKIARDVATRYGG